MLVIARCTVLTGGLHRHGGVRRDQARIPARLPQAERGAPSHDTSSGLFRLLDQEQFSACLQHFVARFVAACQGVVAIGGKVLRRSFDTASAKSVLHMVSA